MQWTPLDNLRTLECVTSMTKLKSLVLTHIPIGVTSIELAGIAKLTNLENLFIGNFRSNLDPVKSLSTGCKNLQKLELLRE